MSAQELRAAAAKMREDHPWDQPHLDGIFYNAVADWLDEVAWRSERIPKQYRAAKYARDVARAYLNDQ